MTYSDARIDRPYVRAGWLNSTDGKRDLRGADSWVPVGWDVALDLVRRELEDTIAASGNQAIFAGSYGWASAGRFHHAQSQLHRFLNCVGGFTGQTGNYSYGAAMALLPHIIGTIEGVQGPVSSWDGIAANTRLMVCFGGLPSKNTQVEAGGVGSTVRWTGLVGVARPAWIL